MGKLPIKLKSGIIILFFYLFFLIPFPAYAQTSSDWYMAGANPQRTSWVSQANSGSGILWYRPIEAYIAPNVQLITANNLVYVATARGLYALKYDTGDVAWRFDTEVPLGHSPTVLNGVVYFGSYDRGLYALNATTGALLWANRDALAGYSTNPLVISDSYTGNQPLVMLGNRDGNFYAIGGQGHPKQGQVVWKYNTNSTISYSAAYKNGIAYFASMDNYAHALNTSNGNPVWKSARLNSDGFISFWPVIWLDKVVFSAASTYRAYAAPGIRSLGSSPRGYDNPYQQIYHVERDMAFYDRSTIGPTVSLPDAWAQGKTIIDFSKVTEYLEDNPASDQYLHKPWRRSVIVLNQSDGVEYTFDSDGDGYKEYAPFTMLGTQSGNRNPPVVREGDELLYQNSIWTDNGWIAQGQVFGWKLGTKYVARIGLQDAVDEPQYISGAGSVFYRNLCCDRSGIATNNSTFWHYNAPSVASGYDEMWCYVDNPTDRLRGSYGKVNGSCSINGIYHEHGDQNPLVVYQGKTYVHRSNAVLAFGSGTSRGKLPLLTVNNTTQNITPPGLDQLKQRLENQVQKIISAGRLRPGYLNNGSWSNEFGGTMVDYFENPGEDLLALSEAYPHLSSSLKTQLKTYLDNQIFTPFFDQTMIARLGFADGQPRENTPIPNDIQSAVGSDHNTTSVGDWGWSYPPHNLYALYKYAQNVSPEKTSRAYALAKSKLQTSSGISNSSQAPWRHNAYIAGYIGFNKLYELAGRPSADSTLYNQSVSELNRLNSLRVSGWSKDSPFGDILSQVNQRTMSVSRNFIFMVPELGDYLYQNGRSQVQTAVDEYNRVGPYWFVSRFNADLQEGVVQPLYDQTMFLAKAWALKQPREQLAKYLDAPAFERGDDIFIRNLVATIEAPYSGPEPTPSPSTAPSPTATPVTCVGDLNSDRVINLADLSAVLSNWGKTGSGDLNSDGIVNLSDIAYILGKWGTCP